MTSEGLGEMFEGDSADMCAGQFPLVSMGGRAEVLVCADPRARTPIGANGNLTISIRCKVELGNYFTNEAGNLQNITCTSQGSAKMDNI